MSVEDNKRIVRRFEEETRNGNNLGVVDEVVTGSVLFHDPSQDRRLEPTALKEALAQARTDFPDLSLQVDDLFGEGDRVAMRWTMQGTAKGDLETPWGRFPAKGKKATVKGNTIYRLEDGKIVEVWNGSDDLSVLQQFGATITPPRADS